MHVYIQIGFDLLSNLAAYWLSSQDWVKIQLKTTSRFLISFRGFPMCTIVSSHIVLILIDLLAFCETGPSVYMCVFER